jgi:hypothetical protein
MTYIKHFAFALTLIGISALVVGAQAQTPRMTTVNITPEAERVRISGVGDVSEMRVDVADEQGEVVFQSGQITGQRLDWQMTDSQGERVSAGTYLVTVTFRTASGKLRKRVEQVTVDEAEQAGSTSDGMPQAVQATVTTSNPGVFGTIARFTGESTIANSIITQSTTGKIGISAADPQAKLEVAGNWTGEDGALRLSGDKPTIRFAGGPVVDNQSWIMHLGSNGPGNLEFYRRTGQTWGQVMSLTPAGNVGIGTPFPTANLHVRSGEPFTPIKLTAGSGAGANTGSWRIQADNGLSGQGSSFVIYSDTAQQYRMVINGSGNVGIGTASPTSKLDVRGDIRLGPSGQYRAVSGEENLRIVRGVFGGTDPIRILAGSGFTVSHVSEGKYNITFTTPFSGPPSVTALSNVYSGFPLSGRFIALDGVTGDGFYLLTTTTESDHLLDASAVHFIAIGPR